MFILLTDETNRRPSPQNKFFVYGGLLFRIDAMSSLNDQIGNIRQKAGYKPEDEFKFDTRSRPDHVSIESATEAKNETIKACIEHGCKFIVHVILHDIIKNQDPDRHIYWAADYVFGRFHRYLSDEVNSDGICIVDNLPVNAQFQYLSEKFSNGLVLHTGKKVSLPRIKMFAASCVGASHVNSAMDIVLGSFRYCINEPKNIEAAKIMMEHVMSLLWHERDGERIEALSKGLVLRPKLQDILSPKFKDEYLGLIDHINDLIAHLP